MTNKLKLFFETVDVKFHKLILVVSTTYDRTYDVLYISFQLKPALLMLWENCPELKELKVTETVWYIRTNLKFPKTF